MSLPTLAHNLPAPKKREPNGVDRPIALRLRPDERDHVQLLAHERHVSMASIAAEAVRRGLAQMERENRARAGDL